MLFELQPDAAYVNDINAELISLYKVVRDDVDSLIQALSEFRCGPSDYYAIRDWDRDRERYASLTDVQRAARAIYLNKTCFNGLYRVNSAGEFNTPFGSHKNPNIVNAPVLRAVSAYFKSASITFSTGDYGDVLESLPEGSFAYLDPPYDPVSGTSSFTGYAKGGFGKEEQIRLRQCCDRLGARGIRFMLSNSATDFIREQYSAYNLTVVPARRAINSDAGKRGDVAELVARNYG
jgi:DNA adenine methylase